MAPGRIASALEIMIEGPISAAAFNNESVVPTSLAISAASSRKCRARCVVITNRS